MPRPSYSVRRRSSRVDTESPRSNNESDTISPEAENWGSRRIGMSKSSRNRSSRLKNRPRYRISQTEDDDELVFSPVKRRGRRMHNRQTQNIDRRVFQEQEDHPADYSIRRSTRQRKLKYDNYNDSWIVGSQTVKGYPCYLDSSLSNRERVRRRAVKDLPTIPATEDEEEEEDEEDDTKEEEPQRRILRRKSSEQQLTHTRSPRATRTHPTRGEEMYEEEEDIDESKEEPPRKRVRGRAPSSSLRMKRQRRASNRRPQVESSGDSDDDSKDRSEEHRLRRNRRPPQRLEPDKEHNRRPRRIQQQKKSIIEENDEEKEEEEGEENEDKEDIKPKVEKTEEEEEEEEEDDEDDENESGSSSDDSNQHKEEDQSFQDMYARVKQRRRNNTTATPGNESQEDNRRRQPRSTNKSDSDSSSGEMSENIVGKRLRRHRGSQAKKTTYHLRQVKPTVNRFQVSQPKIRDVMNVVRRKRAPRRRRWSSSSSSDSSRDDRYDRKKSKAKSSKSMALAGTTGATSKSETVGRLADVDPLALDTSIRFSNVGGLESHIDCLKEMVVFPMLYKEIFERFNVTPPKGVLFHGPPGTGKTLMARALANECSQGSRKVSFFMRKGADCLSKWVGESERQLRLLFEEAKQARPSIIFFDELDGLAPVRSAKQDQIHASIVCTLLALMDGLDNRGDIIVIGATNRIDSIDPALRRPGRFDRELYFPLPGLKERREILGIHTKGWCDELTLNKMAEESWGYCGSDLKALCTEAILQALKRVFPQIYLSEKKLLLDPEKVKVERLDFMKAKRGIVPASKRGVCCMSRRLPKYLEPLLNESLDKIYNYISSVFPHNGSTHRDKVVRNPRVVIRGEKSAVMSLSGALLHKLEHCTVLSISLESLHSDASVSPEEALSRVFKEVPQRPGSVLWMGDITLWWHSISDLSKSVFIANIDSLDPTLPVLFLAVSTSDNIPTRVRKIFSTFHNEIQSVDPPTDKQKKEFFTPLLKEKAIKPPIIKKKPEELEMLPIAPPSPPRPISKDEEDKTYFDEENTLRELRIFLRQICAKLARNKQFYMFSKPVDINEVPDYLNIIEEPMDLETMMTKIDLHKYTCAQDFLKDIDLLCKNALEYNPDKDPEDKLIRHRACYLRDTAYALIKAEMDSDFEINCRSIRDKRIDRAKVKEYGTQRFIKEFFPDHQMDEENKDGVVQQNGECSQSQTGSGNTQGNDDAHSIGGGTVNTESRKKKRRSAWSKGLIKKKKALCLTPPSNNNSNDNHVSESNTNQTVKTQENSNHPTVHSTPLKTPNKKLKLDSSITDNSEQLTVPLHNGTLSSCSSDDDEPICRKFDDSIALTEHSFHTESNNSGGEKQLTVDLKGLDNILSDVLTLSSNVNSYKCLIDLYVALERVVHSYSRKWNRTNLVQDLKNILIKFKTEYNDNCDSSDVDEDFDNNTLIKSTLKAKPTSVSKSKQKLSDIQTLDNISAEMAARGSVSSGLVDLDNDSTSTDI